MRAILAYTALFMLANQQGLTRKRFVLHLILALTKAEINPNLYAGHSFHIGAATVAYLTGIEDSTIMTLGKWKGNVYQRYVRIPQEHLAQLSLQITTLIFPAKLQVFHPLLKD